MSHPTWVLGTRLRPSVRKGRTLNSGAIALALLSILFNFSHVKSGVTEPASILEAFLLKSASALGTVVASTSPQQGPGTCPLCHYSDGKCCFKLHGMCFHF